MKTLNSVKKVFNYFIIMTLLFNSMGFAPLAKLLSVPTAQATAPPAPTFFKTFGTTQYEYTLDGTNTSDNGFITVGYQNNV